MADVKSYLRKMDFPDVVPEALSQMQKLWLPDCTSPQLTLMKELSQEFVFFEIDQWGQVREQKMNPIKELQVLERICFHFKEHGPEQKLATFIFLFPFGSAMLDKRMPLLNKLVSLAIGIGNGNVLTYIGSWMQLAGCSSQYSVFLAKNVHQERLRVSSCKSDVVKHLPDISPLFCASLITSLSSMYAAQSPPNHVVETVLEWLKSKPSFCFEPVNMNVPKTFNFSGPQTPLPELLRWTVLAPLDKTDSCDKTRESIFLDLHLAVLDCLLHAPEYCDAYKWESLPAEKIMPIVSILKSVSNAPQENISLALERLAQGLEVGLASLCIHPKNEKLGDLFIYCIDLPYHQLLKIVLQKWSYEVDAVKVPGKSEVSAVTIAS